MEKQGDLLLTVKEVAQEMRVSEKRVTNWIKSGELVALDLGKDYRIYRSDLDAFIAKKRTKQ
jgi:excisionase family DNA binding protein